MANLSKTTQDPEVIRRWAEERGGKASHVKSTGQGGDVGILRIDFPGYSGEGSLEEISWDQWFDKFKERNLAFLYEDETAGGERSNFNKIVTAETAEANERRSHRKAVGTSKGHQRRENSLGVKRSAGSSPSRKTGAKKASAPAKKKSSKKSAVKKTTTKKTGRASASKKAPAKKGATRKATTKKSAVKKAPAKKAAAKKAGATKKSSAKKKARR